MPRYATRAVRRRATTKNSVTRCWVGGHGARRQGAEQGAGKGLASRLRVLGCPLHTPWAACSCTAGRSRTACHIAGIGTRPNASARAIQSERRAQPHKGRAAKECNEASEAGRANAQAAAARQCFRRSRHAARYGLGARSSASRYGASLTEGTYPRSVSASTDTGSWSRTGAVRVRASRKCRGISGVGRTALSPPPPRSRPGGEPSSAPSTASRRPSRRHPTTTSSSSQASGAPLGPIWRPRITGGVLSVDAARRRSVLTEAPSSDLAAAKLNPCL